MAGRSAHSRASVYSNAGSVQYATYPSLAMSADTHETLATQQVQWDDYLPAVAVSPSGASSKRSPSQYKSSGSFFSRLRSRQTSAVPTSPHNIELSPVSTNSSASAPRSPPPAVSAFAQIDFIPHETRSRAASGHYSQHTPYALEDDIPASPKPALTAGRAFLSNAKSVPDFRRRQETHAGTLKLYVKAIDDEPITPQDADTIFTAITTENTTVRHRPSKEKVERINAYGRGGAGRLRAGTFTNDTASLSSEGSGGSLNSNRGGESGGRAYVKHLLASKPSLLEEQRKGMASTESLDHLRRTSTQIASSRTTLPTVPEAKVIPYGRGGAGRVKATAVSTSNLAMTESPMPSSREQVLAEARRQLAMHEQQAQATGVVCQTVGRGGTGLRGLRFGRAR